MIVVYFYPISDPSLSFMMFPFQMCHKILIIIQLTDTYFGSSLVNLFSFLVKCKN